MSYIKFGKQVSCHRCKQSKLNMFQCKSRTIPFCCRKIFCIQCIAAASNKTACFGTLLRHKVFQLNDADWQCPGCRALCDCKICLSRYKSSDLSTLFSRDLELKKIEMDAMIRSIKTANLDSVIGHLTIPDKRLCKLQLESVLISHVAVLQEIDKRIENILNSPKTLRSPRASKVANAHAVAHRMKLSRPTVFGKNRHGKLSSAFRPFRSRPKTHDTPSSQKFSIVISCH